MSNDALRPHVRPRDGVVLTPGPVRPDGRLIYDVAFYGSVLSTVTVLIGPSDVSSKAA